LNSVKSFFTHNRVELDYDAPLRGSNGKPAVPEKQTLRRLFVHVGWQMRSWILAQTQTGLAEIDLFKVDIDSYNDDTKKGELYPSVRAQLIARHRLKTPVYLTLPRQKTKIAIPKSAPQAPPKTVAVQQQTVSQLPSMVGIPTPVLGRVMTNQDVIKMHAHATDADALFFGKYKGQKFQVDLKRDGERAMTVKFGRNPSDVYVINKHKSVYLPNGSPLSNKDFPGSNVLTLNKELAEDIANALGDHNGIFDSEYRTKNDKFYDFLSQRSKPDSKETMVSLFDVIELDGRDVRAEPLNVRRKALEISLTPNTRVEVDETQLADNEQEARKIAQEYVDRGFEGGVVKPLDHKYDYSEWMLKIKGKRSADVVIMGIEKSKDWVNRGIPRSFLVGVFDKKKNEWHLLGNIGTGLDDNEKRKLANQIQQIEVPAQEVQQAYGNAYDPNVIYTYPEIVIESEYARVTPDGKLREPRIKRVRTDKSPEECGVSQVFPDRDLM
ncbi:MAG: hypothetical protein ACRDF4_07450, partial [Rhabdochlamydiaceae bacterium]